MIDFIICSFLFVFTFLSCGMVYVINHERREQNYISFRELEEKDKPKKVKNKCVVYFVSNDGEKHELCFYRCPNCGVVIEDKRDSNYCIHCGQALDWSEEDVD